MKSKWFLNDMAQKFWKIKGFQNMINSHDVQLVNYPLNERWYTHQTSSMGTAILENIPVTRSEDSTLFREIS